MSRAIDLYSAYVGKKNTGAPLIDHKYRVQQTAELGLVSFYSPGTREFIKV